VDQNEQKQEEKREGSVAFGSLCIASVLSRAGSDASPRNPRCR